MKKIVLKKIREKSFTKKFLGLTLTNLKKLFPKLTALKIHHILNELIDEGSVIVKKNRYFTPDWIPTYTNHEKKIIDYLDPIFQTAQPINPFKLQKEFTFINEESLKRILMKLELEEKVVEIADLTYLSPDKLSFFKDIAKKLNKFTTKEFKLEIGLSRNSCEAILDYFDARDITRFDGTNHTYNIIS